MSKTTSTLLILMFSIFLMGMVGYMGYVIVSTLSSDALAMAAGLIAGVMSGIPSAILVASAPRQMSREYDYSRPYLQAPPSMDVWVLPKEVQRRIERR